MLKKLNTAAEEEKSHFGTLQQLQHKIEEKQHEKDKAEEHFEDLIKMKDKRKME